MSRTRGAARSLEEKLFCGWLFGGDIDDFSRGGGGCVLGLIDFDSESAVGGAESFFAELVVFAR